MKAPRRTPFTDEEMAAISARALEGADLWETCEHVGAGDRDHSCPRCGGTLRRCCLSLVGAYDHADGCPEVERRSLGAA